MFECLKENVIFIMLEYYDNEISVAENEKMIKDMYEKDYYFIFADNLLLSPNDCKIKKGEWDSIKGFKPKKNGTDSALYCDTYGDYFFSWYTLQEIFSSVYELLDLWNDEIE